MNFVASVWGSQKAQLSVCGSWEKDPSAPQREMDLFNHKTKTSGWQDASVQHLQKAEAELGAPAEAELGEKPNDQGAEGLEWACLELQSAEWSPRP